MSAEPRTEIDAQSSSIDTAVDRIAKRSGVTLMGKSAGLALRYFVQLILAWALGPARFGTYALAFGIYQFGELFARVGLGAGGVRYTALFFGSGDHARLKGTLRQMIRIPFATGCLVGAALFLGAGWLAEGVFGDPALAPMLRIFALAVPLGASATALAFATTGFQSTKYMVYGVHIVPHVANLVLVVLLLVSGLDLWEAALAWALATGVAFVASLLFVNRMYPDFGRSRVRPIYESGRLLRLSLPLMAGDFLWVAMLWTDVLMLGYLRSSEEVGIYRAASQTAILLTVAATSIDSIFMPMMADLHGKRAHGRMNDIYKISTRWSLTATLPIFLIVGVASSDVMHIYGDDFVNGSLALTILAAGQLVNAATGGCGSLLAMTGRQHLKLSGDLFVTVSNVTLNLLLIPRWGILGAAVATSVSVSATNVLRLLQVHWFIGLQPYTRSYLKIVAAGLAAAGTGLIIDRMLGHHHFVLALGAVACAVVLTFSAVLFVLGLEDTDVQLIRRGWSATRARRSIA